MERLTNYKVDIMLPNGEHLVVQTLAVSKWHAVDKTYSKFMEHQADRSKYTAIPPMIVA